MPHGASSTSPDVERFGTTLQGFVPTAFLIQQIDPIAPVVTTRDHRAEHTFRARCQVQRVRSRTQCRPFIAITNAANRESTLNMGRRIMAERGRKRGKRARRVPPVVRRAATASIDARGDDALRALVRILARQAAREVFESELQRNAASVH